MAKKIRFPLEMADGAEVRNLDDLKEHFDLGSVLEYYKSGKLLTWLQDRYLEEEADVVSMLDETMPDFLKKLCEVFGVEYAGDTVDMEEIARRQERLERLRTYTDEAVFIEHIDQVAFDQEELADLLDEDEQEIYLCGNKFTVPASRKGITYIGISSPEVHISGKIPEVSDNLNIQFKGIQLDNLILNKEYNILPQNKCAPEISLDEVSDNAFYAFADLDGISVCIETENYILYIDREIDWDTQFLKKHLFSKKTGTDEVKLLQQAVLSRGRFAWSDYKWKKSISEEERRRIIKEDSPDSLIQFLYNGIVACIYGDMIYFAVPIESSDSYYSIYEYNCCTDERKEILSGAWHYKIAINHRYLAYEDREKGVCVLDLETGKRKQIRFNGDAFNFHREWYSKPAFEIVGEKLWLSNNHGIYTYDLGSNQAIKEVCTFDGFPRCVMPFPEGVYWSTENSFRYFQDAEKTDIIKIDEKEVKESGKGLSLGAIEAKQYRDCIIVATPEKDFPLYYINQKTHEKVMIGRDCGERSVGERGWFSDPLVSRNPGGFCRIGETVYFEYHDRKTGEEGVRKVSLRFPMQMETLPPKDDSGRKIIDRPLYTGIKEKEAEQHFL